MRPPVPRSLGSFLLLAAAALAIGLVALGLGPRLLRGRQGGRLLLVVQVGGGAGDFTPTQGRALALLAKDALEVRGLRSVSLDPEPPPAGAPLKEGEVLVLRPTRQGSLMGLQADLTTVPGGITRILTCPAQPPARALDWLLAQLPGPKGPADPDGRLLPREEQAFWDLVEGLALHLAGEDFAAGLAKAARAEARSPGSAAVALLQGDLHYGLALSAAHPTAQDLNQAQQGFEEALRRWPHLPRAGFGLTRLYCDTGHVKKALAVAEALHRAYPRRAHTCSAILYAGRFAGLLRVVDRASLELDALTLDPSRPQRMQVGQLYLGQWSAFERSLWTRPGDPYNAMVEYHLGYLRLLQGRREDARNIFLELERKAEGHPKYVQLGRVYRLALEGKAEQARRELQPLDDQSTGLAVPDGEFTFRLAEAWAFAGDPRAAVEAAGRALGQGFACARWYEKSPLLQDLQALPRWTALMQSLRQRQARLEARFPPERFG